MKNGYRFQYMAFVLMSILNTSGVFAQEYRATVHAGLFHPLSTHGADASKYSNSLSLHGLWGVSREERAYSISGIATIVQDSGQGFQASGITNVIGGHAEGFTAAGILNAYQSGKGFQAAGIVNLARGPVSGMQAAGFYNQAGNVE